MKETTLTAARPIFIVLLAAVLGGCGLGEAPLADRYYRVTVATPATGFATPPLDGVVEVARLVAEGLVGQRAVAYVMSDQPHEIFDYNYHFWNQAPGELVQEQLIRFLRGANAGRRVVSPDLRLNADFVIDGRIRRFEQVFDGEVGMQIEIDLGVIRAADNELMMLNTYRAYRVAQDDSLPAAVVAANAGLADIFAAFAADLRSLRART